MTSQIDPTVPIFGTPTTASVRNNFLIAKNEITALQGLIPGGGGSGGGFGPPILMQGSGTIFLATPVNYFVYVDNSSGAPITVVLPSGLVQGQQIIIKDIAGNAGTYTITISVASGIDGNTTHLLLSDFASVSVVWLVGFWGTF